MAKKTKNYDKAIEKFKKALQIEPGHENARIFLRQARKTKRANSFAEGLLK